MIHYIEVGQDYKYTLGLQIIHSICFESKFLSKEHVPLDTAIVFAQTSSYFKEFRTHNNGQTCNNIAWPRKIEKL